MQSEFIDILPVLACSDIAAEHDFLVRVLGFTAGGLQRAPNGMVVHGEVRAGERRIWLHLTSEAEKFASPAVLGGAGAGIVVHVKDVDAHYEAARKAGAAILHAPTDQPYGQREYALRDPDGHSWWIAAPNTN